MQGFPQDIYYGRLSVCQSMGRNAGVSPGHLLRPALCMSVNGAECRVSPGHLLRPALCMSVNGAECRVSPGHLLRPALCMSVNGAECRVSPGHLLRPALYLYVSQWGVMQGFPQDIYYGQLSISTSVNGA